MVIFVIIFIGFMFSINNLYWYYTSDNRNKLKIEPRYLSEERNDLQTDAEKAFGTIDLTLKTMFWTLFGLIEEQVIELDPFIHPLTENMGFILFGTFNFASIIVLLNMLIASITMSYVIILVFF